MSDYTDFHRIIGGLVGAITTAPRPVLLTGLDVIADLLRDHAEYRRAYQRELIAERSAMQKAARAEIQDALETKFRFDRIHET